MVSVSYTHLRAHETDSYLVCRLLLEKKKYAVFCLKKKNSFFFFFFLMIRRQPRSTHCISSAASDVYKRQKRQAEMRFYDGSALDDAYSIYGVDPAQGALVVVRPDGYVGVVACLGDVQKVDRLSLIHI